MKDLFAIPPDPRLLCTLDNCTSIKFLHLVRVGDISVTNNKTLFASNQTLAVKGNETIIYREIPEGNIFLDTLFSYLWFHCASKDFHRINILN